MSYKRNQVEEVIARIFFARSPLPSSVRASSGCLSLIARWAARFDVKMLKRPILHSSARGSGSEVTGRGREPA
jgi:hypothetical protein